MKSRFFLTVSVRAVFVLGILSFKASGNPDGAAAAVNEPVSPKALAGLKDERTGADAFFCVTRGVSCRHDFEMCPRSADRSTKPADMESGEIDLPLELTPLMREASDQSARGNFSEAEKILRQILERAPNNIHTLSYLGVVLLNEAKYQLAEEMFNQVLAVAPEDGFSHCTLGIVYYQESKLDEAVNELTKALAINPKNPTAHNYLGITASQKGWPEAARKELETAVSLDASYADAYFNLAVVLATNDPPDKESAGKYYQQALELGSERDESLEQLIK